MKAEIGIYQFGEQYRAVIRIKHPLLDRQDQALLTKFHTSKGQLKRKAIQFCADLNLDYVIRN